MKRFTLFALVFLAFSALPGKELQAQYNFVGFSQDNIKKVMAASYPAFSENRFGSNSQVNSIKYVDGENDRTLIFFFNKENVCEYTKLIEDIESLEDRVAEFNQKYKPEGELSWLEAKDGKTYRIKIEKTDYSITILSTEKK